MPEIGLSLPPAYLADSATARRAGVWQDAFGHPARFLESLARAGVEAIELRSIPPDAAPDETLRAVHCVQAAGMRLTIHGRLPREIAGDGLDVVYPALLLLRDALARQDAQCPLVLHCYSGRETGVEALSRRTVLALRRLLDLLDAAQMPVQIALETNHVSANDDPGVTYDGIVDMIARVNRPHIGACWDMGHTTMNVLHGRMPRLPPAAFLDRVIHTHVHDLRAASLGAARDSLETHHPLTHGVVPVDEYLNLLRDRGYDAVLDLELSPQRFPDAVHDGVWASLERLIAWRQ